MNSALSEPKKSYRWKIIWLCVLLYIVLYVDRACLSMVAPLMMKHFQWDAATYGTVAMAFFIGYTCTNFLGGWAADKIGAGRLLIMASLVWSLFVFLTPLAPSLGVMLVFRFLMGAGEGVALPAVANAVSNWVPRSEGGKGLGLALIGVPLGMAIAMPLSAAIAARYGWQSVFFFFALWAPVWCVIWKIWGADKPQFHKKVQQWEKDYILADRDKAIVSENAPDVTMMDIIKVPSIWILMLGHFALNYMYYLFVTWLPNYFVLGKGMTMNKGAIYSMIPYLGMVAGFYFGGHVADAIAKRIGDNWGRRTVPLSSMLITGLVVIAVTQTKSPNVALALITFSAFALSFGLSGTYSTSFVFSQKRAGSLNGIFVTFASLAGIAAPQVTGLIVKGYGYDKALLFAALLSLCGAVFVIFGKVKPIIPKRYVTNSTSGTSGKF